MHVVVVGAGPSGFSLSLALAREGIEVTLLERDRVVSDQPRAAHLTAPGIQFLRRIGVLDDIQKAGFPPKNLAYRKLDGTAVVTIEDTGLSTIPDPTVVLTQNYLGNILLSHAEKTSGISIKWGCRVIDVGQDENSAWAVIQQDDGTEKKITGDFLCGCDGGTSQVRKSLFGAGNFPGTTWDFQFVAADVYYPFDKFGYEDVNMVMHPEHCHLVARIAKDDLWRVAYQEDKDMTYQQVVDNQPAKFELLLPGHPKPESYTLTHLSPYRLHQRCAEKFRVGRICLAADAAHLCNPWGGLGLTGGFADVSGLSECLLGIATGKADHSILDKYDEVRRGIYNSIINPVSTTNLQRVSMSDPDKALEDPVLAKLATASTDPKVRGELEKGAYALCYDFTQHYNNKM